MPLTLYSPAYGTLEPSAKNNGIAPDQNLDNFYLNYNASLNRMFKRSASDKVFSIMGIGATAFVWGMVVKQAIEGKPNPNANPPKQEPKPQRKPL